MSSPPLETDILNFIEQIEQGETTLAPLESNTGFYSGNQTYLASNGWEITVFIDAGEWDYIAGIKTKEQQVIDFDALDAMAKLRDYTPSLNAITSQYRLDANFNTT